ncbi:MAG: fasciclin domain-containing protein [Fodinibius sp.]|nr:fasciclin domain-containing protein [Fodinibius sp.]
MLLSKQYINRFSILVALLALFEIGQAQNIMQQLKNNARTSHFARALAEADLQDRLNSSGPFTLFAPSNSNFDKLNAVKNQIRNLLLNHIFTGMATERSLKAMSEVTCLSGETLIIVANNSQLLINEVPIVESNIRADNGVIHIIDGVIK